MTVFHTRLALNAVTLGCAALCVAAVGVQWAKPVPPIGDVVVAPASAPVTASTDRADFADVLDVALYRPLEDPTVVTEERTPPLGLEFKLLGTVVEPEHTYAIFQVSAGRIEVRSVGEHAGPAEVVRIEPRAVTIRHDGQTKHLSLPKPGQSLGF